MLHKIFLPSTDSTTMHYTEQVLEFETFTTCPACGSKISPKFIHANFVNKAKSLETLDVATNSHVNALYECPHCYEGIVIKYKTSFVQGIYLQKPIIQSWNPLTIESIYPVAVAQFPFNQVIIEISDRFKNIYTQSLQAKLDGKNELVGIGYRKSIEFLIKDYLIHINHEKKDKIPSMHLGDCIKLIENQKIQNLATASTWLGNDETHYVRKHSDKDIQDLEKFLNVLVNYLAFELTADEASSFIHK